MTKHDCLLELIGVSKSYGTPLEGASLPVLNDVDLKLESGASLAVVGPSGSGKSTLLNIMGGLDTASSGTVRMRGKDLAKLAPKELARIRSRELGFVFQLHHLLNQLTVLENVLVPTLVAPETGREERARKLLDKVGLTERIHHRPGQLSGGERQRVALVRALINEPGLLLADEPTGSLDRSASGAMGQLLMELNREEEVALVVVTHSLELAQCMDRVLELRDGGLAPMEASKEVTG